ncbi:ctd kinase subunit gamma [Diplodia corticola]|uniref:Ctd kinase subunit gamma n=1 Tax=Diplodia corticola TaxID=236234 RepID=A0A1J9QQJ6_9PEZI|nr:ctd kinase subunit gamma [Diplodia corticola]OJD30298.1 ctd kinase subunit gamma [Diplodia corticola]
MADPFEVRMRFTSQLQHLNASVTSAQKAANYALKYRDMDEDLHSCILEQLERNNMNNRANIMYFIEHLCDVAQRESHLEFVRMMQRDILRVIDAVAPPDGSGAANVKVVRRVLAGLQNKQVLLPQTVQELEDCLKERDNIAVAHPALGSPTGANGGAPGSGKQTPRGNGAVRLDKRQVEQRIEEDRERHKRLREVIWQVDPENNGEFEKLWEESSDIGDDDYIAAEEDAEERRQAIAFDREL